MKINKEENVLVTGYNGGSVTAKYNDPKIITQEEANEKLHKILNIEEEIGIDLIKAVKLCKQVNRNKVVYTKEKWGIDTLELLDELDIELFNHRLYGNERGIYVSLDLYNYGITWALTKEELEQNE